MSHVFFDKSIMISCGFIDDLCYDKILHFKLLGMIIASTKWQPTDICEQAKWPLSAACIVLNVTLCDTCTFCRPIHAYHDSRF